MEYQSGAVSPVGSIQEGWKIIKDDYWTFFLMTLVTIVIVCAVALILGLINSAITSVISLALGVTTSNSGDMVKVSASLLPQIISMFISIFVNIIVGALSGSLVCGIYMALSRKVNSGSADFGDVFSGFQKFKECLIVAAIMSLVRFVISLGMLFIAAGLGVSAFGLGMFTKNGQPDWSILSGLLGIIAVISLIYLVISIIISALTTFVYPLIGVRDLSGGQSLMVSIKSGLANIGGLILLLILLGLMAFGGLLVCLVGILFVAPIISSSIFAAFQSVFGKTGGAYQYSPPSPPVFNQPGY